MGKLLKFNILCSTRKACPEIKKALKSLGFDPVEEIFDKPTADIQAIIKINDQKHLNEILTKVSKLDHEKISQVTVSI